MATTQPSSIPQPTPNPCHKYLQEDDLTQECKSLIASSPKQQGWVASYLYLYQGCWQPSRQLQGVLTCQTHFNARSTDIILATTPKSGTTWLKALLYAIVNRASQSPGGPDHSLLKSNPHDLIPFLELKVYVDHQVPDLTTLPSPRVFSTHMPFGSLPLSIRETGCKIVYLCRNPKDIFISMWHFANKLRPQHKGKISLEEAFDKFCKGVSINGPFWDHVLDYWKHSLEIESTNKIFFLKYEDLKENPVLHLKRLAEFCGCPFSKEEQNQGVAEEILKLCSFDNLSNLKVNKNGRLSSGEENRSFFRKGEIGDWINYLSPQMTEKIDKITQEKFSQWGLIF
uniref:Sulfotransferase n=1 Tax=Opuntia streptacantha TaxID=393608 RepID=A0A7C8ZH59_OPUST